MKYRRRTEHVEAVQATGSNQAELRNLIRAHTGREFDRTLPVDAGWWLVLQANGRWWLVPETKFAALFIIAEPGEVVRSCFGCSNYGTINGAGICGINGECIESEIAAADGCSDYDGG